MGSRYKNKTTQEIPFKGHLCDRYNKIKKKFATKQEALVFCNKFAKDQQPYYCEDCHSWHIGHEKTTVKYQRTLDEVHKLEDEIKDLKRKNQELRDQVQSLTGVINGANLDVRYMNVYRYDTGELSTGDRLYKEIEEARHMFSQDDLEEGCTYIGPSVLILNKN